MEKDEQVKYFERSLVPRKGNGEDSNSKRRLEVPRARPWSASPSEQMTTGCGDWLRMWLAVRERCWHCRVAIGGLTKNASPPQMVSTARRFEMNWAKALHVLIHGPKMPYHFKPSLNSKGCISRVTDSLVQDPS